MPYRRETERYATEVHAGGTPALPGGRLQKKILCILCIDVNQILLHPAPELVQVNLQTFANPGETVYPFRKSSQYDRIGLRWMAGRQ